MKGIIYKIEGYGLTYYGSTIQKLNERKANHKSQYKNRDKGRKFCTSWLIIEKGDDWTIEQVEEIEINDIDELRIHEAYYQKNNECVNKQKMKTIDEMREYKRLWAEQDRRDKGMKKREEMILTKDPNYYNNKAKEYKAKLTDEQKQAKLEARRKKYAENKLNDKQREYINRPEVKERRRLQQIAKRKNILIEE
jgi:hypothetical protein